MWNIISLILSFLYLENYDKLSLFAYTFLTLITKLAHRLKHYLHRRVYTIGWTLIRITAWEIDTTLTHTNMLPYSSKDFAVLRGRHCDTDSIDRIHWNSIVVQTISSSFVEFLLFFERIVERSFFLFFFFKSLIEKMIDFDIYNNPNICNFKDI